ncbi:protein unc-13 homolog isoform X2 [Triticum urartu]|uniref:MHD1 domain-containing protein n=1 Tax=Triticum urartu TaxID=4572 RepID=A0A8R7TL86_TRIUA|nr:protein unc-13 homolog isoform X2 [Triticum urartu]
MDSAASLLEAYRRDRRRLLGFLLSSAGGRAVDLSRVDLDAVSADYALDCVASGAQFDASEATRRYFDDRRYPIMTSSPSGNSYFLLSRPEGSGSPPKKVAPDIGPEPPAEENSSRARKHSDSFKVAVNIQGASYVLKDLSLANTSPRQAKEMDLLSLGLPRLNAELSDDDLRETAYEVLLASLFVSGKMYFAEEKREKKPKFLKGLRSKTEGSNSVPQMENYYTHHLDLIRVQMEISESMDTLAKRALRRIGSKMVQGQLDVPCIALQLLSSVGKFDFPTERLRVQWQRRQVNVLEELLLFSASHECNMSETLRIVLSKLKNTEDWVVSVPDGRIEVLTIIERYNTRLSTASKKFGLKGETYHWTQSYHFNSRLYEKLLSSVFDILEDGQLVEEADEILETMKLTWPILGITQKLHDALYAWVLFQKFAQTREILLLKQTDLQIQKLQLHNNVREAELYMDSFVCSVEGFGSNGALNLVDSALLKINMWCRRQLKNYHLYFSQANCSIFESMLNLVLLSAANLNDDDEESMLIGTPPGSSAESTLIHILVVRSIQAAYKHALIVADGQSKAEFKHPLILLASELKLLVEKECSAFSPVLHKYYPEAGRVALTVFHLLYGQQLELFLEGTDHSENLKEILGASNSFELCIAQKLYSMYGEAAGSSLSNFLKPYMIDRFSSSIILQWLHAQHENVLEWTKRTIEIEDWEPLSVHRKLATSMVEVFRIVEETIDQFFNSSLPLDIVHLRSLLIGITSSLQVYLLHMENQQVSRATLLPVAPVLTRYAESVNPFARRKPIEPAVREEKVANKLKNLTVPQLCVKLNTLQYIRDQLDTIEEGIKQSWVDVQSAVGLLDYLSYMASEGATSKSSPSDESIDELFTIFDDVRRTAVNITDTILNFIGTRAVFWDMRDSLLFSLYRTSVESARMEIFIPTIEQVLDQVCDLIVDVLRDRVVLRVFQACMEGFIWVLLDGGPSRAFLETDVNLMKDDLAILKDLFIAEGQGLPSDVIEKEAKLAQQILDLYVLKADIIIDLLMKASEHMSHHLEPAAARRRNVHDIHTLLRVLCHKKDNGASTFLKIQYHLPRSSDYDDVPVKDAPSKVPIFSDMLNRGASFNWSETGQQSFRIMKKKLQEASWQ